MSTEIIATVGPASFGPSIIKGMDAAGVDIFRVNLSHTEVEDFENVYNNVSSWTDKPVCPDTQGVRMRPNHKQHGFSAKDLEIFPLLNRLRVPTVFLSFCSYPEDVARLKEHFDYDVKVVSKIESARGLHNMRNIAVVSDALLIDRGDLSKDVPLGKIPYAQDYIMEWAWATTTPVYVATNLMESMMSAMEPTRAEVNDIVKTLDAGASGLVLAGETAIGRHPEQSVVMLKSIIDVRDSHSELDGSTGNTAIIEWLLK